MNTSKITSILAFCLGAAITFTFFYSPDKEKISVPKMQFVVEEEQDQPNECYPNFCKVTIDVETAGTVIKDEFILPAVTVYYNPFIPLRPNPTKPNHDVPPWFYEK